MVEIYRLIGTLNALLFYHQSLCPLVDREDDKQKSQTNDDWGMVCRGNREPIRLTTKEPEPLYFTKRYIGYKDRLNSTKMVQALDREKTGTTILKDMIEQAELQRQHKHLLQ